MGNMIIMGNAAWPSTTGAQGALLDCLGLVPCLSTTLEHDPNTPGWRPDIVVRAAWTDGRRPHTRIACVVLENGQPRLVRRAIHDLFWYITRAAPGSYGVIIAPYISPSAGDLCEREGYGYIDLAGNCHLSFDDVFIHREGRPNPTPERRELRSLFSPRAERVLRVLLSQPRRVWRLHELAEHSGVSGGYAHRVKEQLLDREWLVDHAPGLRLLQPERMLRSWAENYNFARQKRSDYHSLLELEEIEAAVARHASALQALYGFTGFSGSSRIAPLVRYQRVHAYINSFQKDGLVEALKVKPVTSGANLTLLEPYDEGVFYDAYHRDGISVVSPVQLYLDLRALSGRGEDAAEFLLDSRLRPEW